jgi:hypothetical protein
MSQKLGHGWRLVASVPDVFWRNMGMLMRRPLLAALVLMMAAGVSSGGTAAEMLVTSPKPLADAPFFLVNDNRVTFSYIFAGTSPGMYSVRPDGSINGKTEKAVYSFTHFDVWAYGTNFANLSVFKSGRNDPAAPCIAPGVTLSGAFADCPGATEVYGLVRSTLGFNEMFNTKAFSIGPLRNVSLEVGADANSENNFVAPAKRDVVAGLQFAFDLPYRGFFNVAPLVYYEFHNHNAFLRCGLFGPGVAGVTCSNDGSAAYRPTWAVELNYFMELGFLPESIRYFAISGRAGFYGRKGNENAPLNNGAPTAIEINSEPIRLTFDLSRALLGSKEAHAVDLWVAYRYWENKFGLDDRRSTVCNSVVGGALRNNGSCTEQSLYAGVTMKF